MVLGLLSEISIFLCRAFPIAFRIKSNPCISCPIWSVEYSTNAKKEFQVTVISSKFCKLPANAMLVSSSHETILGKTTKYSVSFLFSSHYQLTIEWFDYQYTLGWNFKSFQEVNFKFKGKPRDIAKLCARKCVLSCANPLYLPFGVPLQLKLDEQ